MGPRRGELAEGVIEIVDTREGERFRLTATRLATSAGAIVAIDGPGGIEERLPLSPQAGNHLVLMSVQAPAEPHEFTARLQVRAEGREEVLPFQMAEPAGHAH